MEPVTIVLVNALATDLELYVRDQVVANPVEPAEHGARAVRGLELYLGQSGLQVDAVDQITVALDRARDLLAEVRGTIEGILNGLHREVRVATVHNLEDKLSTLPFGIFRTVAKIYKGLDSILSKERHSLTHPLPLSL